MKPRIHGTIARVVVLSVLFVGFALFPATVEGQVFPRREFLDVITVADGSVLKGKIIEHVPDRYVVIELYGGSSFVLGYETIESIEREENPDYSLAWVKKRIDAPERTGTGGLIEGGHIFGVHAAGGFSWFTGPGWEELTDEFDNVDEEDVGILEFGLSWRWLRPLSPETGSPWMWGLHGSLNYAARDGRFEADDPLDPDRKATYDIYSDIVRLPLEFLFGVGGNRFALLAGAGPGVTLNLQAPQYEFSSVSGDESGEIEEKSDLSLFYTASLGVLVRMGRAWVLDTQVFADGQFTASTKEQLFYRAWGVSLGIGYRIGG